MQPDRQPACHDQFGEREDMLKLAEERLALAAKEAGGAVEKVIACDPHKKCTVLDQEDLGVIYFLDQPRELYHKYAGREVKPLNRADFLAGLTKPFRTILG